jgi:hypothetical protein
MAATIQYPSEPAPPALHIPASDDELRMIGELCALQSQIELLMQLTAMVLRKTSLRRARKLLSSANFRGQCAKLARRHQEERAATGDQGSCQGSVDEIEVIKLGRHDFVQVVS